MEQKFSIELNSRIISFTQKFGIKRGTIPPQNLFEAFSNYTIVSNLLEEDFEGVNKISTGKAKGIDGIAIIVNNKLIADESDLNKLGENEKLQISICFIQSTTMSSFETKKFQSFIDEVINFLTLGSRIEPFSDIIFEKLFNEENDYLDRLKETPKVFIFFSSGCTDHKISRNEMENEKKKIIGRRELYEKFTLGEIQVLQKNELNEKFDNIDKYLEIALKFHKSKQLDEKLKVKFSLISSIKYKELKKLIETKEGNLREKLFIENPRSVVKDSNVNDQIKETLSNSSFRDYFIYLNNGLTILCDAIRRHEAKEDVFWLKYPRIINGCQTTHMLFDFSEENKDSIDELDVFVKVIATEDKDLKNKIIFATNNQNSIDKDLQALNEFHTKLEEYFQGIEKFDILYERLRGQYSKINPPYKKIDIENIAKVFISVLLQLPHEMKSNAIKKIESFQTKEQKIFRGNNYDEYYYCAVLFFYFNSFIANNIISLETQTMDMHLLLVCDLILSREGLKTINGKIKKLERSDDAMKLFIRANKELSDQRSLFERRGFYSGKKTKELVEYFSNTYVPN